MNPDNIESNQLVLFSIYLKLNIQAIWTFNVIWHFRKNFIKNTARPEKLYLISA